MLEYLACKRKETRVMLSDELMNCIGFEENPISDFSKRIHNIKSDKMKSGGDLFPCRKLNDYDNDDSGNDDIMIIDPRLFKEESFGHKRKQEPVSRLLNWLKGIAKNPCNTSVSSLPEKSKWKSYGNEEIWKQVLLVREAMLVKRHVDSSSEQAFLQRTLHPCLYDDDIAPIYNLRERLKLEKKVVVPLDSISKSTALNNSSPGCTDSSKDDYKPIALGPNHQAQVPEWTGVVSDKSDAKWFGTPEWPLKKPSRFLLERDPIGKGRQDSCGCPESGSSDCVKFHISEKRYRIKLELGAAFFRWKFDKMGEDVKLSWTLDEERKFENIVSSNPPSLGKCFWDEIVESFPSQSWVELVSYYYNVFLLRRRGHQNRVTPENIDSDDDSESGTAANEVHKSPGSILYSPKKPR